MYTSVQEKTLHVGAWAEKVKHEKGEAAGAVSERRDHEVAPRAEDYCTDRNVSGQLSSDCCKKGGFSFWRGKTNEKAKFRKQMFLQNFTDLLAGERKEQ